MLAEGRAGPWICANRSSKQASKEKKKPKISYFSTKISFVNGYCSVPWATIFYFALCYFTFPTQPSLSRIPVALTEYFRAMQYELAVLLFARISVIFDQQAEDKFRFLCVLLIQH
jgi:hypothetical protein